MSQETIAILGVMATMIGLGVLWFFMSPKDMQQLDRVARDGIASRVTALENAHQALALRFENSHARHDESLENLTHSIDRLTKQIERLETHVIGKGAGGRR
jgi:hypothetical protein